jgi:hypothetical protein
VDAPLLLESLLEPDLPVPAEPALELALGLADELVLDPELPELVSDPAALPPDSPDLGAGFALE